MTRSTTAPARLNHTVSGQRSGADTVVSLHGWPNSGAIWDAQIEHLGSRFQCVNVTLPGAGPDPVAPVPLDELMVGLSDLIDSVSPDRPVTLLLHDWGCVFGYEYAMRHSGRVARIVAVDIGDASSEQFLAGLSLAQKVMIGSYQAVLAVAWSLPSHLGDVVTRALATAMQARTDAAPVTRAMNWPYAMRLRNRLGGMAGLTPVEPKCPVMYVYGKRKPVQFHSTAWLTRLESDPASKVLAVDSGHWVMIDEAALFSTELDRWLAATQSSGATPQPD